MARRWSASHLATATAAGCWLPPKAMGLFELWACEPRVWGAGEQHQAAHTARMGPTRQFFFGLCHRQ
jgi:hypothetical protein